MRNYAKYTLVTVSSRTTIREKVYKIQSAISNEYQYDSVRHTCNKDVQATLALDI